MHPSPVPAAWSDAPPLADPTLAEVFATHVADGAATGFTVAHLQPGARVLWVQDRLSRREGGRPLATGFGVSVEMLHLEVAQARDALWALEQALGCGAFAAVVGEVWGEPRVLDFTATKRLALRSEAHKVRAWLIRRAAHPDLSAARERWRLASLPSAPPQDDARAPGEPAWSAILLRARGGRTGEWVAGRGSPGTPAFARGLTGGANEVAAPGPRRQRRATSGRR